MVAKPSADALLALSGNLLGSLPPLAQPLKYLNNATDDISLAILLALELIGNLGAAFVDFVNTTANWDEVPTAPAAGRGAAARVVPARPPALCAGGAVGGGAAV